jgi:hypothetical protein
MTTQPTSPVKRINVMIGTKQHTILKRLAKQARTTVSGLLRQILESYLSADDDEQERR